MPKGTNEGGRGSVRKFILLMMVLSLLSCSAEKTAPTGATQAQESGGESGVLAPAASSGAAAVSSIEVLPHEADRHSILSLVPKGPTIGAAQIKWLVNGSPSGSSGDTFNATNAKKGDTIQATATINGKEIMSNEVEIGDTPPEFSRLKIMPEVFKPGDRLYVEAEGKDMDGDPVTISYQWTKNGEPAGTDSKIDSPVSRGDKITVRVTPYDGERYGQPVVFEREIGNMPPMISSDGRYSFSGGVFTCPMHATDPDGDTLTWSLREAPSGMTIDAPTGLVTWRVPSDFAGKTSFTACASDGHGGRSTQVFNFTVK